jgi:hypothetical protein
MSDIQDKIAKAADAYNPSGKRASLLDPHRDSVIVLRAKGASFETIADILDENGVTVSIHTVRRLCRRNAAEIRRRRQEILSMKEDNPPAPTEPTAANPPAASPRPPGKPKRDLRGPV